MNKIEVSDKVKDQYLELIKSEFKGDIMNSDWGWKLADDGDSDEVRLVSNVINDIQLSVDCRGWNIIINVYKIETSNIRYFSINLKFILNMRLLVNIVKNNIKLQKLEKEKITSDNDSVFSNSLPVKYERKLKLNKIFKHEN